MRHKTILILVSQALLSKRSVISQNIRGSTHLQPLKKNQGKTDTAFKRIQVKDLGARYLRIKFFLPVASGGIATSSNGAVQAEMLRKAQHR